MTTELHLTRRRISQSISAVAIVVLIATPIGLAIHSDYLTWGDSASAPRADVGSAQRAASNEVPRAATAYSVTFQPLGLPASLEWSVAVNNSTPEFAQGNRSVSVSLVNGTYPVSLGSTAPFALLHPQIQVTVNGTAEVIPVPFNFTYTVTFTESGLPIGNNSKWHIFLDYLERSGLAGSPVNITNVTNGTHTVSTGASLPYDPVPQWEVINVNGPPPMYSFTFYPPPFLYNVTFQAAGLPADSSWSVTVDGRLASTVLNETPSNETQFQFRENNGSHVYSASGPSDFVPVPPAAQFVVSGADVAIVVDFVRATNYSLTFVPSGLEGAPWSLNISDGTQLNSSVGAPLVTSVPNGSYQFVVSPVPGLSSFPQNGTVWVAGSATIVPITFFPTRGPVTFSELGLPSGQWWVAVDGENHSASAGSPILVQLPFGTYSYTAGVDNASFKVSVPRGNIIVGVQGQLVTFSVLSLVNPAPSSPAPVPAASFLKSHLVYIAGAAAIVGLLLLWLIVRRYRTPPRPADSKRPPQDQP